MIFEPIVPDSKEISEESNIITTLYERGGFQAITMIAENLLQILDRQKGQEENPNLAFVELEGRHGINSAYDSLQSRGYKKIADVPRLLLKHNWEALLEHCGAHLVYMELLVYNGNPYVIKILRDGTGVGLDAEPVNDSLCFQWIVNK